MPLDFSRRTDEPEQLDDFTLSGDALGDALDKIASINRWLGGNRITLDGLEKLLQNKPKSQPIRVVDIGCGNGDMCRAVARWGLQNGYTLQIIGLDANEFAISRARVLSAQNPNIRYAVMDIFSDEFAALPVDIALCTLTLHHFTDTQIVTLMQQLTRQARIGVIINDLQRSALAYRLFQGVCAVFRLSDLSREDGLISIRRGFRRTELVRWSRQLPAKRYDINWRWAFRYQWILNNL